MKKTLKLLALLLIGVAFTFGFASCGGDVGDSGNGENQYNNDNTGENNNSSGNSAGDLFVGERNLGTDWDGDLALILDGELFSNCNANSKFTVEFEFGYADYYKLKICENSSDWPALQSIVLPTGMFLDEYYGDFDVTSSPLTFSLSSSDLAAVKKSGMVIQGHGVTIKKVSYKTSNSSSSGNNNSGNNQESSNPSGSGNGGNSGSEDKTESGLYIGIISFGNVASDLNNDKFVCLNSASKLDYVKNLLNNKYKLADDTSTLMYYGVHKALVNLEKNSNQLPDDLENVYIITFTDGLDNASSDHIYDYPLEETGLSKGTTTEQYATWLKNKLGERKINGNDIVCYSVGVKGDDSTSTVAGEKRFKEALNNVASSSEHYQVLDRFEQLQEYFVDIAKNLTVTTYKYDFTLRLPTDAWQKERIRMTFDISESEKKTSNPAKSRVYFQGKVDRNLDTDIYTFSIDECKGIKPSVSAIHGEKKATVSSNGEPGASKLVFSFEDIGCEESYDSSLITSWLTNSLEWYLYDDEWQSESEYLPTDSENSETKHSSAVIYLVLDNSTSIGNNNVGKIKDAVSNFIDLLYNKLNSTN